MVQTRSQKLKQETLFKEMSSKEKMAIETLLSLSEMDVSEPEPENILPPILMNPLNSFSQEEIYNARTQLARKHCHNEMNRVDLPMPELVKYCPYTGTIEQQLVKSKQENNLDVYNALQQYKDNMINYENTHIYLKNNFENIKNNFTDAQVLNYLNEHKKNDIVKNDLMNVKEQLNILKDIKSLKEKLMAKKLIQKEIEKEISQMENDIEKKLDSYKKNYP